MQTKVYALPLRTLPIIIILGLGLKHLNGIILISERAMKLYKEVRVPQQKCSDTCGYCNSRSICEFTQSDMRASLSACILENSTFMMYKKV